MPSCHQHRPPPAVTTLRCCHSSLIHERTFLPHLSAALGSLGAIVMGTPDQWGNEVRDPSCRLLTRCRSVSLLQRKQSRWSPLQLSRCFLPLRLPDGTEATWMKTRRPHWRARPPCNRAVPGTLSRGMRPVGRMRSGCSCAETAPLPRDRCLC